MAYATDEIGSLQKTGSANRFGSSVSFSCESDMGRPTTRRFVVEVRLDMSLLHV